MDLELAREACFRIKELGIAIKALHRLYKEHPELKDFQPKSFEQFEKWENIFQASANDWEQATKKLYATTGQQYHADVLRKSTKKKALQELADVIEKDKDQAHQLYRKMQKELWRDIPYCVRMYLEGAEVDLSDEQLEDSLNLRDMMSRRNGPWFGKHIR